MVSIQGSRDQQQTTNDLKTKTQKSISRQEKTSGVMAPKINARVNHMNNRHRPSILETCHCQQIFMLAIISFAHHILAVNPKLSDAAVRHLQKKISNAPSVSKFVMLCIQVEDASLIVCRTAQSMHTSNLVSRLHAHACQYCICSIRYSSAVCQELGPCVYREQPRETRAGIHV